VRSDRFLKTPALELWQHYFGPAWLGPQHEAGPCTSLGSGKSFPYWMPLLYIKYGIVILVAPLKLLGKQFVDILEKNQLRAVSMTAANATNELFKVCHIK
jgi:hypothetical protein